MNGVFALPDRLLAPYDPFALRVPAVFLPGVAASASRTVLFPVVTI